MSKTDNIKPVGLLSRLRLALHLCKSQRPQIRFYLAAALIWANFTAAVEAILPLMFSLAIVEAIDWSFTDQDRSSLLWLAIVFLVRGIAQAIDSQLQWLYYSENTAASTLALLD